MKKLHMRFALFLVCFLLFGGAKVNAQLIKDGGFEATSPADSGNPSWSSGSQKFDTALCLVQSCGPGEGIAGPRTGNGWIWFDGTYDGIAENAYAEQSLVFPSGGSLTLNYYLRVGQVTLPASSMLLVLVDGTALQTIPEPAVAETTYTLRTVNVSQFADGAAHLIRFEFSRPADPPDELSDGDCFTIDDVSLSMPPPTAAGSSISGRITLGGRGIANVIVSATDDAGNVRTIKTNPFGYYALANLPSGKTYFVAPSSKRYKFAPQVVNLFENLTEINFSPY